MKLENSQVHTPFYLKTEPDMPFPEDKFFYLLTRDGLYIGRNHLFFQSLAKAKSGPAELQGQAATLTLRYPKIPRALLERAVGFFHKIYKAHDWESALILVWNQQTQAMELVCPDQKASMASVNYDLPTLPPHLQIIGDLHSHCDFSPTSSYTDEHDEMYRPGLHLVVGFLQREPPKFYCAAVVDGTRFEVDDLHDLAEDYHQRDPESVPEEWLAKVKEKKWAYSGGSGWGWDGKSEQEIKAEDREKVQKLLSQYMGQSTCPSHQELYSEMFRITRRMTYPECEKKAEQFIKAWKKAKGSHAAAPQIAA